jgi:hypothetical protein
MNERIRQLADEAGLDWHTHWNDDESNRLEKFAELLLEECCQICIDKWVEKTSEDARDCYLTIQEHFEIGPKYEREN